MHAKQLIPATHLAEATMSQEASGPSWQDEAKCALRWLMFIPGGFLGGALLSLLVYTFLYFWYTRDGFLEPISGLISAAFSGMIIVETGCWIAPIENKAIPAKLIGAVSIVIFVLAMLYYVINGNWRFLVQSAICVIAIFHTVRVKVEEAKRS